MSKFFTKFGSHYAIERFGVIFLSLMLCMCLLLGTIFSQKLKVDQRTLTGRAVYTSAFSMSLTSVEGSVTGVYTNKDHTRCFLLWHFDDITEVPVSVDEYYFLLKGYDLSTGLHPFVECNPAVSFYIFGTTGYMGLCFYQQGGFPSQVLELTIRSLNNFPGGTAESDSGIIYDEGRIFFNPGGSYATKVSFLDVENWSPFDAYNEIITRPQENNARNLLKSDLNEMHSLRLKMDEYEHRLASVGILPSNEPIGIAGDNIYATVASASVVDQKPLEWSTKYNVWMDMETNKYYLNREINLNYVAEVVPSAGFYFDWQDGSVKNGYLRTITGSNDLRVWAEYVSGIRYSNDRDDFSKNLSSIRWYQDNGAEVDLMKLGADGAIDTDKATYNLVQALISTWSSYYDIKTKYHCTDLAVLLDLERDVRSVDANYDMRINNGNDLIRVYSTE